MESSEQRFVTMSNTLYVTHHVMLFVVIIRILFSAAVKFSMMTILESKNTSNLSETGALSKFKCMAQGHFGGIFGGT